jgi:hypothetical protein
MKEYLFKFDQPYKKDDTDIFAKGCIEKSDNLLPVFFISDDRRESIGQTRLDFDEIGVFAKDKVIRQPNSGIGFIVQQCRFEKDMRIIEKAKILELFLERI